MLATFTWRSAGSSKVDETTSARTLRAMSVTSSGRSSISSTIMYTSGWLAAMAFAISLSNTVLPVLGCATISPRCPLPIGENKSTIRTERESFFPEVRLNFTSGKSGVRCSKGTRSRTYSGDRPLILFTLISGKYFSPSLGGRMAPFTVSPVLRPKSLICDCDT
ncbi:hypothetical protein SDC9_198574 [bioreactor metagenome]|uniref:Uncharacterized protein n=1 Tax=bioreactor metagenome TaxID=1076179 RepID=A0A645IRC1_9ZZZZ